MNAAFVLLPALAATPPAAADAAVQQYRGDAEGALRAAESILTSRLDELEAGLVATCAAIEAGDLRRSDTLLAGVERPKNPPARAAVLRHLFARRTQVFERLADGRSRKNPFTKHKPLEEPEVVVADPTEGQVATFLRALGPRWIAVSLVAADTGLRKGELGRLERRHLDLASGKATVTKTKNRKKTRTVYLTPRAIAALENLSPRPDGLVFGHVGEQRYAFRKAAKAAGLDKVRFHDRHFFATRLLQNGADIREVMAAGGWTTLRMVQRYTHAGENPLRQATARLAAAQAGVAPVPVPSKGPDESDAA